MPLGYYLTEKDRRDWRADHKRVRAGKTSQRSLARRRRGPKGEGGGKFIPGLLIAEIPAATIAGGGAWTVTAGSETNAVVALKAVDGSPGNFQPVIESGSAVKLTGKNVGKTALRGSDTEPILVWGLRDGTNFIVLHAGYDNRILPDFDAGKKQAPFHKPNEPNFQLGGKDCPDVAGS